MKDSVVVDNYDIIKQQSQLNGVRSGSANAVHPGAGLPPAHPQKSERQVGNVADTHVREPNKRKSQNSNRSKSA